MPASSSRDCCASGHLRSTFCRADTETMASERYRDMDCTAREAADGGDDDEEDMTRTEMEWNGKEDNMMGWIRGVSRQ